MASPDLLVPILLVDDTPANLLALEAVLDDPGYRFVRAASGEQALERLAAEDFAVVLLDLRMPGGMDGFETARRIRAGARSARTPVVFLSAAEAAEFPVEAAYDLGAVDYLVMPVLPAVLRSKVAALAALFADTQRARQQAEQFRLLVQNTTEYAIFMLDPAGRIATWNAGAERIKGYAADEIVGRHFSLFYPPDAVARGWPDEELRRAVAAGRFEDEGWRVRRDGTTFWANVVITALRDDTGRLRGFSKVTRDMTDRRRREEELERRVEERTAALAAANAALRDADRRKDEFLATLAHELRNPLAPIRNALHVLSMAGGVPDAVDRVRGLMERQVGHLARLLDDLLDVSRVTRGKVSLRVERVDLREVAHAAVETSHPAVEAGRHALAVDLPGDPVWVTADRVRLTQVLTNLLNNAAKYTPTGGRIRLGVNAEGDRAVVRVADSGVGLSAEMLPAVFDLFAQADRTLDRAQGGLGIGLSLVKALVEMHGGTVEARSDGPGRGSEFVVRLPRAGPA